MRPLLLGCLLVTGLGSLAACGNGAAPSPGVGTEAEAWDSTTAGERRRFERALVFATGGSGDGLMVPWVLEAVTRPGGVDRIHRGWLLRDGEWEPFYRNAWSLSPRREPWRILPDGPFRILVGEGGRLDRVVFDGEGRELQLVLDESLAEWTDGRGSSFNLLDGALILGDRRVPGRILDVSQGLRSAEPALGDWLFLTSDGGWSVILEAATEAGDGSEFQLWALGPDGTEEPVLTGVRIAWSETRTFEPARRPIPEVFTLTSTDGTLAGRLEVTSLQLETREGDGPVLPVDGLIGVAGELEFGDRGPIPVHGVLRHRRRSGAG